jgi:hypothetical protein
MSPGRLLAILLAVALAIALLSGCDRSQVQDLSDAKAGAQAYLREPDPERRTQIAEGVMAHLLAGLEQYPLLPLPTRSPAQIRADPAAYRAAGEAAQADPQPYRAEDHPTSEPTKPGPFERLAGVGESLLRWGLPIGALAASLLLGLWVAKTFGIGAGTWLLRLLLSPLVTPLLRLAALWGTASAALGAALTWLAAWWWAVVAVVLLVGGVLAWVHWRDLRAWWRGRKGRA